jgi:hypothetical protein
VVGVGRKPAERGPFRPFVRTTSTGPEARFGPFSVSLRPLSLTQPNHGHFGTDARISINQLVTELPTWGRFERTSLRRSDLGPNDPVRSAGGRARALEGFEHYPGHAADPDLVVGKFQAAILPAVEDVVDRCLLLEVAIEGEGPPPIESQSLTRYAPLIPAPSVISSVLVA